MVKSSEFDWCQITFLNGKIFHCALPVFVFPQFTEMQSLQWLKTQNHQIRKPEFEKNAIKFGQTVLRL
jgi:hypothetical protein